jgi:hypothetical protein
VEEGRLIGLTVEGLEHAHSYLEQVMARLSQARMARPDAAQIADEFRNAAALLRHACTLGIARLQAEGGEIPHIPIETRQKLAEELEGIIAEYRRLWLARNRPGGLSDSIGRLERLFSLYLA